MGRVLEKRARASSSTGEDQGEEKRARVSSSKREDLSDDGCGPEDY